MLATMPSSERVDFAETVVETASADETRAVARRVGELLSPGDFVALIGPLGAGKTVFVQGLAEGLGVRGPVTSPTFVLMRMHRGTTPLCHADAYRLDAAGLVDLGLDDWREETVVALEWADTVAGALPDDRIEVHMAYTDNGRRLRLRGIGPRAASVIERVEGHARAGD